VLKTGFFNTSAAPPAAESAIEIGGFPAKITRGPNFTAVRKPISTSS
jgi:hypothetical protein